MGVLYTDIPQLTTIMEPGISVIRQGTQVTNPMLYFSAMIVKQTWQLLSE